MQSAHFFIEIWNFSMEKYRSTKITQRLTWGWRFPFSEDVRATQDQQCHEEPHPKSRRNSKVHFHNLTQNWEKLQGILYVSLQQAKKIKHENKPKIQKDESNTDKQIHYKHVVTILIKNFMITSTIRFRCSVDMKCMVSYIQVMIDSFTHFVKETMISVVPPAISWKSS